MIDAGTIAPDFEAQADDGRSVKLSDLRGKPVVLYFYPKDDTPGCTKQACGIRDAWDAFSAGGIEVLGVSRDDVDAHKAFKEKFRLPFTLLADADRTIGDAYGIDARSDDNPNYRRTTVLIRADGTVAETIEDVDPATHADDVLSVLSSKA